MTHGSKHFCALLALALAAVTHAAAQTLKSIVVSPNPAMAAASVPVQMHATGSYTDGSSRDLTNMVTWSGGNALMSISSTGLLTVGSGAPPSTITATLGSVSGSVSASSYYNRDSQTAVATVPVGVNPEAIVANPVTNKIYVANQSSNTVTVIDGATNLTTTIHVGFAPVGIAVNTLTNQIYVANSGSSNVTEIDGVSGSTSAIPTGAAPGAIAVNPVTNQILVASPANITIIDGVTKNTSTIATIGTVGMALNVNANRLYTCGFNGIAAIDVASRTVLATIPGASVTYTSAIYNPLLNQVYFGDSTADAFFVLDATTNQQIVPSGGLGGGTVALNPVTNQVVASNGFIGLYNAVTNVASNLAQGFTNGWNVAAMNPVTNQVYLVSNLGDTLGILDGNNGYDLGSTLSTGAAPTAVAVNPATNRIYVANSASNSVTMFDGATNNLTLFNGPASAFSVDVNPFTNTAYFGNSTNGTVSIVNGATGAITPVPVGQETFATLVNPITNKIYALNSGSNSITVIDGVTQYTTTISTGESPVTGVVNPLTDMIYALNSDGSMTVINGATNQATTLSMASPNPSAFFTAMAINLVTNKVYVADKGKSAVAVLDGATNTVSSFPAGANPIAVAVNSSTNFIYAANLSANSVTAINAVSGVSSVIPLTFGPDVVAVNPFTNTIYASGAVNSQLTIAAINGSTNVPVISSYPNGYSHFGMMVLDPLSNRIYEAQNNQLTVGIDGDNGSLLRPSNDPEGREIGAVALAIDPVHEQVFAANSTSLSGVVQEEIAQASPLSVSIGGLPNNLTTSAAPSFTLTAVDGLDPNSPSVEKVYFRFDTSSVSWTAATLNSNGTFTVTAPTPLLPGFHTLAAWASNGRENTVSSSSFYNGDGPLISPVARYGFYVTAQPVIQSITLEMPYSTIYSGLNEQLTATAHFSDGTQVNVTNTADWSSSAPQAAGVSQTGMLSATGTGTTTISATFSGVSASESIKVVSPVYHLAAVPSISKNGSGNYVVQLTLMNAGNLTIEQIGFTLAQLNSAKAPLPAPIASLAPGATASVQLVFPSSAGADQSAALLKVGAQYLAMIPGGSPQSAPFTANYRLVLP